MASTSWCSALPSRKTRRRSVIDLVGSACQEPGDDGDAPSKTASQSESTRGARSDRQRSAGRHRSLYARSRVLTQNAHRPRPLPARNSTARERQDSWQEDRDRTHQDYGGGAEGDRRMKAIRHEGDTDVPRIDLYHTAEGSSWRRHRPAVRDGSKRGRPSPHTSAVAH